jgi:hypothetical protein
MFRIHGHARRIGLQTWITNGIFAAMAARKATVSWERYRKPADELRSATHHLLQSTPP